MREHEEELEEERSRVVKEMHAEAKLPPILANFLILKEQEQEQQEEMMPNECGRMALTMSNVRPKITTGARHNH